MSEEKKSSVDEARSPEQVETVDEAAAEGHTATDK
jgi:hypothetical protein